MREIKFRAWDKDKKEMYYDPSGFSGDYAASWSDIVNDNPHLMQFTGLKDKNGNEIWEGDIVESWRGNEVIEWKDFYWSPLGGQDEEYGVYCKNCEVIGNIYENEILKTTLYQ